MEAIRAGASGPWRAPATGARRRRGSTRRPRRRWPPRRYPRPTAYWAGSGRPVSSQRSPSDRAASEPAAHATQPMVRPSERAAIQGVSSSRTSALTWSSSYVPPRAPRCTARSGRRVPAPPAARAARRAPPPRPCRARGRPRPREPRRRASPARPSPPRARGRTGRREPCPLPRPQPSPGRRGRGPARSRPYRRAGRRGRRRRSSTWSGGEVELHGGEA